VRFVGGVAAPTVESVVEQHPCFELLEVVRMHAGKTAMRRAIQGPQAQGPGVRCPLHGDDGRQMKQRRGAQSELLDPD
jgi:hypothetical protein